MPVGGSGLEAGIEEGGVCGRKRGGPFDESGEGAGGGGDGEVQRGNADQLTEYGGKPPDKNHQVEFGQRPKMVWETPHGKILAYLNYINNIKYINLSNILILMLFY